MTVTSINAGAGLITSPGTGGATGDVQLNLDWGASIYGTSGNGLTAINGQTTTNSAGLYGRTKGQALFTNLPACGVWGDSDVSTGVVATSASGEALFAKSTSNNAIHAECGNAAKSAIWGNNSNGGYGVSGSTAGAGHIAGVWGSNSGVGPGVRGTNSAAPGGSGGLFEITNSSNASVALAGQTNGGGAGVYGLNTGKGLAMYALSQGSGTALQASGGTGMAANFSISDTTNSAICVKAVTLGTGIAGHFECNNINSQSPALDVVTSSQGPAALFNGGVNGSGIAITTQANRFALNVAKGMTELNGPCAISGQLSLGIHFVTDAANIEIDFANGNVQQVTLNIGITAVTKFLNLVAGATYTLILHQDLSGNRTITSWPASAQFGALGQPKLSVYSHARDVLIGISDGTSVYFHTFAKSF